MYVMHGLLDSAADSQNVSDDSDGPHVTRCVILLRTQHFRSYKRREGTEGVHVDEGDPEIPQGHVQRSDKQL